MMQQIRKAAFLVLSIIALSIQGCTEDSLTIGKQFIHSSTYTELVDSVSLRISTFKSDSIQTSAKGVALVGQYYSYGLGTVVSRSYLAYSNSGVTTIDDKEIYDSLTITLKYSGYSLGDTLRPFKLRIHRVTDSIASEVTQDVFFNTSQFGYTAPIDSFSFYPRPKRGKNEEFKMNEALGKELWQLLLKNKLTTSQFESSFRGLMLSCDTTVSESVIGFTAQDTAGVTLRLYSHIRSSLDQSIVRKISLKGTSYEFNHIDSYAELDTLASLTKLKNKVSESATNKMGFMQCGTDYYTRIDFPYLDKMQEYNDRGRIVKAILLIRPVTTYLGIKHLPKEINISTIDKLNYPGTTLTNSSTGSSLTGNLVTDLGLNEDTYYSYDITSYINGMLSQDIIQEGDGLVLMFPSDNIYKTIDVLHVGGYTNKRFQSKLLLYYYNYDKN